MHEFMEIAKQTRLMALATQGELVTTHAHIKRFERQLDIERDARMRLEVGNDDEVNCEHSVMRIVRRRISKGP